MSKSDLIVLSPAGLYCPAGDFYIDPSKGVSRAIITHGHSDHARGGSKNYYCHKHSVPILKERLKTKASLQGFDYGQVFDVRGVRISLHSAGHILGSAQVRLEHEGKVWVISGDYKRDRDPSCIPFEVVPCDVFVTESTFGLPIFRWPPGELVAQQILRWWDKNVRLKRTSVLGAYSLGKAQRLLAHLAEAAPGRPIYTHPSIEPMIEAYRQSGVLLPNTIVVEDTSCVALAGELVIAPPLSRGTRWMRLMPEPEMAFASGWMLTPSRLRSGEWGFVLSDHADYSGLLSTCLQTGAQRILTHHGFDRAFARTLSEQGITAHSLGESQP